MCFRYYVDHNRKDYYIPSCLQDRFLYLQKKIQQTDKKYQESVNGHIVEFNNEFSKFQINFPKRSIWELKEVYRKEKTFHVKILKTTDSVIYYKELKPFLWFSITTGYRLNLNKWSFVRLFREVNDE